MYKERNLLFHFFFLCRVGVFEIELEYEFAERQDALIYFEREFECIALGRKSSERELMEKQQKLKQEKKRTTAIKQDYDGKGQKKKEKIKKGVEKNFNCDRVQ